jgi:SAM-dependent methyltransferase
MVDGSAAGSADWYRVTATRRPTALLTRAVELMGSRRRALDIGAGAGADARYLLQQGFHVTALDADSEAETYLRALPHQERLIVVIGRIEDFLPGHYDLVYSWMSLFFLSRSQFRLVWQRATSSLQPGGIIALTSLGHSDPWRERPPDAREGWVFIDGGTFLGADDVDELVQNLDVLELEHNTAQLRIGIDGHMERHHIVHLIARKPPCRRPLRRSPTPPPASAGRRRRRQS